MNISAEELAKAIYDGRAKQVHLYPASDMLRPQGSMKSESLSSKIFIALVSAFRSWGNPRYTDSITDERELIRLIQKNLHEEVEIAVEMFLDQLQKCDVDGAYRYKM